MKKWLILLTICLDWSLMWIDFTAVNVALAPIARDFHTSIDTLQWVMTAYTLCSAALMAIGGRLGDMYGHKKLFIIGTLIFIASSALAGIAPNASLLILSRVGQGIGISMVAPITTALVYLTFEDKQKGLALGFLTGTTGVAMALGPTVGGILVTALNWRWVFYINVPIGLVAVLLALWLLPKSTSPTKGSIDFSGILTLAAGLVSLLLALNKFTEWGLSIKFIALFLASLLLLGLFIFIETRVREPLIHLDLLKNKTLMSILSVRACAQYIFFVFMFIISLYMQNILGFSAEKAGYLLLTATFLLGLLSPFAGHLLNYLSVKMLVALSCFVILLSLVLLLAAAIGNSMVYLYISLACFGIGYALHFPATNLGALQFSPKNQSALVTGILFTLAFAGASAGITFSGALLTSLSQSRLTTLLPLLGSNLAHPQTQALSSMASGVEAISTTTHYFSPTLAPQAQNIAHQAFVFGFTGVIACCAFLAFFGLLLSFIAIRKNNPHTRESNTEYILDV